jgi:hypothetical protein
MPSEVPTVGGEQSFEELRRELAESREQQTATADILRVISTSPMDLQRAFAEIAASAARLCDAHDATIFLVDGDHLSLVATQGPTSTPTTLPIKRELATGRAVSIDERFRSPTFRQRGKSTQLAEKMHYASATVPF